MIPENTASSAAQPAGLTLENAELLTRYADHLTRSPLPGHRALEHQAKLRYLRTAEAWPSARDCAIALLPLYAGARITEIRALDITDIRLGAGEGEVQFVGKGGKSRTVTAVPELRDALAAWLEERPSEPGAGSAALFPSTKGTRMTTGAIAEVITAIAAAAGMDHVTGHVLRHTFGAELIRHDVDVVIVAELMGHASTRAHRLSGGVLGWCRDLGGQLPGTAVTGAKTRPATRPGCAPSIPATTTMTRADLSWSSRASMRCSPAMPASTMRSAARPKLSLGPLCDDSALARRRAATAGPGA